MRESVFEFGYGNGKIAVALPEAKIINNVVGKPCPAIADIPSAVREALRNPIGTPPLKEVVEPGDKVAIVVSDITRAWVKFDQFLPVLLDELNDAGIPDQNICIVIAPGAHRLNTEEEFVILCGDKVCKRVAVANHDCHNQDQLVYTGKTKNGVDCYINRSVAEADKVILTGGIVHHLMAGFGGGRKAILPGISGFKTIQGNHLFCMNKEVGKGLNPNCISGKLEGNEMNEDMIEQAALAKPDFLLNAVFTPENKFARFVAGHWHEAWLAGTKMVDDIYGVPVTAQADLVVSSAGGFPKDINLYQGVKTIDNAYMATKPGGVVICFMELPDIMEPAEFSNWFNYPTMLEHEMALRANFTIPGFLAYRLLDIARQISLIIVTKQENAGFIRKAGMIPAATAAEALAIAQEKLGREDYTITVMTAAANTVPVVR
ncbi:nickel-dependent lactate racemase [Sporomusa sphaeroides]|jgi:nickel-dependent lactate racemase|uniref:nickel-dependent lactate racemase n=1 Tax=Sporomusa sphaeroides TaxID=47679 RepID=UPI002CC01B04|nr:nickel-dependent lactate racemase [Sporomusa sphaeroides]HML32468.1 nickel-dependent lactate racemase [Sporomusa sphaeroides]